MADLALAQRWQIFEHRLETFRFGRSERWAAPVRALGRALYLTRRFIQGARRVETGGYDGTFGLYEAEGVSVAFGGAVPIQGDGEVDGHPCYYRSRGEGWSFEVYARGADVSRELPDPIWEYGERRYFFPFGGWVTARVSMACIARAVAKFRERGSRG
jgi:hypothetical protein